MKIRRELKVGVFAVIVILVSWWGIKWLQGHNLLKTSATYYARYDDVTGLMESSRVWMRGVDVGSVTDIELLGDEVLVEIVIQSQYADMIKSDAVAQIGSAGLMGGQQISIIQGVAEDVLPHGATMQSRVDGGLFGMLADKGSSIFAGLNQTLDGVNGIIGDNSANIAQLVANLESMTAAIDKVLAAGELNAIVGDLHTFSSALAENTGRIESMLANLEGFTGDVADADIVAKLDATVNSLNAVIAGIDSGEGSVGKLLNDNSLYESLNTASENLALLLEDLKANPMRYVHISVFGKSEEQIAAKQAKQEAKAAKRAAKEEVKQARRAAKNE